MAQQQIRQQLELKRQEILGRLQKLHDDVHHRETPFDPRSTEQAIELQNLDVLFELDDASRHELSQINNALQRLDDDEYEFCAVCGERIESERLRALPYAETCRNCAS